MANFFLRQDTPTLFEAGGDEPAGLFMRKPRKREKSSMDLLREREEEAQQLLELSPGGPPEPKPAPLERIADIFLRPTYAVAGAAEEFATTQDIQAAFARAGREFFSGIGGLKGEKRRFGDVLAKAGVAPLGHLSSVMPFLFNETGKGWKFKKGGLGDITGRGVIGFALDTPLDPLTYVSFGTSRAVAPAVRALTAQGVRVTGKRALTKAGVAKLAALKAEEMPEALRFAQRLQNKMSEVEFRLLGGPRRTIAETALPTKGRSLAKAEGVLTAETRKLEKLRAQLLDEPFNATAQESFRRQKQIVDTLAGQVDEQRVLRTALEELPSRPRGFNLLREEEIMPLARDVNFFADEMAYQSAISKVDDLIRQGAGRYADAGGIKFMGKTIVAGERFKPIGTFTSRMLRHVEETPYGAQILSGMRSIKSGVDRMFNETLRAARNIPGVIENKAMMRAEQRLFRGNIQKSIGEMTKGWGKAKLEKPVEFAGSQITRIDEYVALHLDDPKRFPIDALPEAAADKIPAIRQMLAEQFAAEARYDLIDPRAFRQNYFPHSFDNSEEQLRQLSTEWTRRHGSGFDSRFNIGPHNETRVFPTFTDAMEFAGQLRREGTINFDLKPRLNLERGLARRGEAHATAISAQRYFTRTMNHLGMSKDEVGARVFADTFPEIQRMLRDVVEQKAAGMPKRVPRTDVAAARAGRLGEAQGEVARIVRAATHQDLTPEQAAYLDQLFLTAKKPGKTPATVLVGRLLARGLRGEKVSLTGVPDDLKALYWMGRVSHAESWQQLRGLIKRHGDEIAKIDPGVLEKVRALTGTSRRQFLNSFNEPYKFVGSGPFKGMYMPDAMADDTARLSESILNRREVRGLLKTWDLMQDIFKTYVTVPFVAFHFRNNYSNVASNFTDIGLSAFDPRRIAMALAVMTGRDATLKSPLRRYTANEIRQLFVKYGLATPEFAIQERLARGYEQSKLVDWWFTRGAGKLGASVENHAKLINFTTWLERGLDPQQAALRTHRMLFDYEELAPFEREIMRRIFPFYTWTSKNLRLMAQQVAREPGRIATTLKLGDFERGPDREALPDYLRGDFKVRLRFDKNLTYITGIDLPLTSAVETVFGTGPRSALTQNMSSLTPFLKTMVELGTKRDLWRARDLEEREFVGTMMGQVLEKMPKPMQNYLELQKGELQGEPAYSINGLKAYILFKSYALGRIYNIARSAQSDDVKSALVDFFTGVDLKEFDLAERDESILRNRVKEMERELVKRGVLVRGRPFLPKSAPIREKLPKKQPKKKKAAAELFR